MSNNIFADLPQSLPEELYEDLLVTKNVRIEKIISTGQASPPDFWYDQNENEWVIILKGEAKLEFEGQNECMPMKSGDYVFIPAHQKHRVSWTSPNESTVWLAVFFE